MSESKRRKNKGQYPYKRDTGIVRLPDGSPIREEVRDSLNKFDPSAPRPQRTIDIQRSSINMDGRTTKELQEARFNGLRRNEIAMKLEIWITGEIVGRLDLNDVDGNPGILATELEKIFGTKGHLIEMDNPIPNPDPLIYKS